MKSDAVIELRNVSKAYERHTVLRNINLQVQAGEFLTLLGPSGCGKTTILRLLAGFEQADSGEILIAGRDMRALPPEQRHINTVFQSYALFPHLTVFENVAFGPRLQGIRGADLQERVLEALRMVKLEDYSARRPGQLSGGQQQRVGVARALAADPAIILMDEPFGAVDPITRRKLQDMILELQERMRKTIVFVTHDMQEALTLGHRVAVLDRGELVSEDTAAATAESEHPFVRELIGATGRCAR